MKYLLSTLLLFFVATFNAQARDPTQVRAFRKLNPCPATQLTKGACPGYVVDHIIPLCIGGPDEPRNLQWQSKSVSLSKDKLEWEVCRKYRKSCPKPSLLK
jgi:hypothetical protein